MRQVIFPVYMWNETCIYFLSVHIWPVTSAAEPLWDSVWPTKIACDFAAYSVSTKKSLQTWFSSTF